MVSNTSNMELMVELDETRQLAHIKERLLLVHIQEAEGLYSQLRQQVQMLEQKNRQIEDLTLEIIQSLARTLEAKDQYTEGHSQRVAQTSTTIAQYLQLPVQLKYQVQLAAQLHDLGKIGIKEAVLNKTDRLTDAEFTLIKQHPIIAQRILQPLRRLHPVIAPILHHHEHFDGKGYPDGLQGEAIPLAARIIAVADAFDAMTSARPYRDPLPMTVALDELHAHTGSQFDPKITAAFLASMAPIHAVSINHKEEDSNATLNPGGSDSAQPPTAGAADSPGYFSVAQAVRDAGNTR